MRRRHALDEHRAGGELGADVHGGLQRDILLDEPVCGQDTPQPPDRPGVAQLQRCPAAQRTALQDAGEDLFAEPRVRNICIRRQPRGKQFIDPCRGLREHQGHLLPERDHAAATGELAEGSHCARRCDGQFSGGRAHPPVASRGDAQRGHLPAHHDASQPAFFRGCHQQCEAHPPHPGICGSPPELRDARLPMLVHSWDEVSLHCSYCCAGSRQRLPDEGSRRRARPIPVDAVRVCGNGPGTVTWRGARDQMAGCSPGVAPTQRE
mmetsp:Transcript_105014/g.338631  ORF Transcript_105014/g.338631 Transcript_105014/m.338631 type:complete len:265 (+) Transcript_105014:1246-2040(+)